MPKEVVIVIKGQSQSLQKAAAEANTSLRGLSGTTEQAGREAVKFGERIEISSKLLGNFGAESSETVLKVQGLAGAFKEARLSLGGFGAALRTLAGSFLLFAGLDFIKESAHDAMEGEASWNKLTAAYRGNAEGLASVREFMERTKGSFEGLGKGMTQAVVASLAATARMRGMDPTKVLDPAGLNAVSRVLGKDIPHSLDIISRPRGGTQLLSRLGLSAVQIRAANRELSHMDAQQRTLYLENLARQSPAGAAVSKTAAQNFQALSDTLSDLKDEVGTALLPALISMAQAFTGIIHGVDDMTRPFGGLANVLKTLLLPMLLIGLKLFLGLRGGLMGLVDLLVGRLTGAFAQTATSMADADSEAKQLGDDIRGIPEEWPTTAIFISAAATGIKDAYKANVLSIPKEWPTKAIFEDAVAMKDMAKFREAAEEGITIPVAAEAVAANALAADEEALREQAHAVSIPVVAEALSAAEAAGEMAADRAVLEKERGSVGIPVVAEALSSTAAASEMGADRAILEKERGTVGIPVIAEALSPTAAAREMEADRAILEKERGSVGIPVIAENLAGNKAERAKAKKEMLADRRELQKVSGGVVVPVVAENLVGSKAEREKAKREVATDVRELRSLVGTGVVIPIRAEVLTDAEAKREIVEDHDVLQKAAGAEGVHIPVTGLGANIPVKAGIIDEAQAKKDIAKDAAVLEGEASKKHVTIPVTGVAEGGVAVEPVLAGDAPAREQVIRNKITNGIGEVLVPVDIRDHATGELKAVIADEQTFANAHPVRVGLEAIKEGAGWGAMGLAFSVASMVVTSKVTYVRDKGTAAAAAPGVQPQATPTVAISNTRQVGSDVSSALVNSSGIPVVSPTVAPAKGSKAAAAGTPTAATVPTVPTPIGLTAPAPAALIGTGGAKALRVQASQEGHWKVDVGAFDTAAIVEMFLTGVAVSLVTKLGGKIFGSLKNFFKDIKSGALEESLDRRGPGSPPMIGGKRAGDLLPGQLNPTPTTDFGSNGPWGGGLKLAITSAMQSLFIGIGAAIVSTGLPILIPIFVGAAVTVGGWFAGILETVMTAGAGIVAAIPTILATTAAGFALVAGALVLSPRTASAETVKEANKARHTINKAHTGLVSGIADNLKKTFGHIFSTIGGTVLGIAASLINGIKSGISHFPGTLLSIGAAIINGIKTAVMSGIVNLVNGIIGFFNSVFKKLSQTPIVGKAFEKVRIPTLPVPPPALHSTGAGRGAAGLSNISPADRAALSTYVQNVLNTGSPATRSTATAVPAVQAFTVHANFTINDATDANQIARLVKKDLTELVSGVKSTRRLAG